MANQFLNAQEYANVMLLLLKNQLVTGRLVDGQFKDQVTDQNGLSINVKRPPRFVANSGPALATQDVLTGSVNITVDQYENVHVGIGDLEYVQSYNALMQNQTMKSAASTLAHKIDGFLQDKVLGFHSWVGNGPNHGVDPTLPITSPQGIMPAHTRLMEQGAPDTDLSGTVMPYDGEKIRAGMLANFTPSINVTAQERARIPVISEVDWYATQQVPSLTTGTRSQNAGATAAAGGNVNYRDVKTTNVQTLNVTNLGANATVAAGEVFTIAGVFSWDWRRQTQHSFLQQFTVTQAATANGAGAAALTISPPIIVQGTNDGVSTAGNTAFATVGQAPGAGALLTFVAAPSTALRVRAAWQKRAISLVSARLQLPFTGTAAFAADPDTGISIRYWRGSDITTGQHIHRWDTIYGGSVMDPFLGTRIGGASLT